MATRITMSELARELGVSKATVCRALKNDLKIASKTRERIQEEAKRRGYRPNPLLSATAARRWASDSSRAQVPIAYLSEVRGLDNTTAAGRFIAGAKQRAEECGYAIRLYHLDEFRSSSQLSRVLYSCGIEGIIVGPIKKPNEPLNLDWDRFSAVSCGGDFFPPPLHKIQVNQNQLATLAYRTAIEFGYRRIGIALDFHPSETPDDAERLGAFSYQQRRYVQHLPEIPILTTRDAAEFEHWFRRHEPDVVIGLTGKTYDRLLAMGLRPPEDVGFMALLATPDRPDIAYIDNLEHEVGSAAFDYLEHLIRSHQVGIPRHRRFIFTEAELHLGNTIRKVGSTPTELAYLMKHSEHGSYRHAMHSA